MKAGWLTLLTLAVCAPIHAASVRGRILQTIGGRTIPAGGISVTLLDGNGKRSFAVVTDSSGMYYFQNVAGGNYTVQIWRKPGAPPIPYPITVREPRLDVNPLNLP